MIMEELTFENKLADLLKFDLEVENEYLRELRRESLKFFVAKGLPTRKEEEWKYSDTRRTFKYIANPKTARYTENGLENGVSKYAVPGLDCYTVVLINGVYAASHANLSGLPKGALICGLDEAFRDYSGHIEDYYARQSSHAENAFTDLNTAAATSGLFVYLENGVKLDKPLHIVQLFNGNKESFAYPRNLFVVGDKSSLAVVETQHHFGASDGINIIAISEITLMDEASMQYYLLEESENSSLVQATYADIGRNAHFDTNTITINSAWVRNDLEICLNDEHSEAHLNGLFLATGEQHIDNQTMVDHRLPHCNSNQLYKGVLNGKSSGVFNGKIFVQRDAQKTNAYQSSKNILLSEDAVMNTKPQLEIFADDVKCSHGTTTGQLDEEALFYLRARGIGEHQARVLLLTAYAQEVLEKIQIDAFRNYLTKKIEHQLPR